MYYVYKVIFNPITGNTNRKLKGKYRSWVSAQDRLNEIGDRVNAYIEKR